MDPQQRLLLEVSWEALEHAGIIPESLRLSRTGVFVGVSSTDYVRLVSASAQQKSTIWDNTGGSSSIIANRISYFLDIQGPSIVIDTACSSSLVAVHLACRSLSTWDCDIALVGGTNVLISPEPWGGFREAGILSQTGCCHAFDKSADGMVRGEGCGVIVLQRLSDARLEGRRILAILTGSAVNQDGKSNGIMAPNPSAQIGVLENACKSARVDPLEIGYVEAHGTGTSLGDRIEAHALGMVFGRKRPGSGPLMIGSIKPNIGHLEGAAGIAGLIKAVLMVERGSLLPSGGVYGAKSSYPIHGIGPESCRRTSGVAGGGGSAAPGWGVIVRLWRHQCACDCRGSWFGWGGHGFGPRGCWRFRWWGGGVGDFGEDGFGVGCSGGSVGAVCAGSAGA